MEHPPNTFDQYRHIEPGRDSNAEQSPETPHHPETGNDEENVAPGIPGAELPTVEHVVRQTEVTDVERASALLRAGDIEGAAAMAQASVEKPVAEKYREGLVATAEAAVATHGFTLDSTAPFKSFGARERFYIRKVLDRSGREVVVKVAAPEKGPSQALEKEERIVRAIDGAWRDAKMVGRDPGMEFPVLTDAWADEGGRAMVTEFVADDKEKKVALSTAERARIITKVIGGLQTLEVPSSLAEAGQRPLDGSAHAERAARSLDKVGDALTAEESSALRDAFNANIPLLDSLPMKLAHGDIHAENLAYRMDASGAEKITLMDLEAVRANNEYFDWATTANLAAFGAKIEKYRDELGPMAERLAGSWIDAGSAGLEEYVENEVIAKDPRGAVAETAYRLMRIQNALEKLSNAKGDDTLSRVTKDATVTIIRQQLRALTEK